MVGTVCFRRLSSTGRLDSHPTPLQVLQAPLPCINKEDSLPLALPPIHQSVRPSVCPPTPPHHPVTYSCAPRPGVRPTDTHRPTFSRPFPFPEYPCSPASIISSSACTESSFLLVIPIRAAGCRPSPAQLGSCYVAAFQRGPSWTSVCQCSIPSCSPMLNSVCGVIRTNWKAAKQ